MARTEGGDDGSFRSPASVSIDNDSEPPFSHIQRSIVKDVGRGSRQMQMANGDDGSSSALLETAE